MQDIKLRQSYYLYGLLFLCLSYLGFEFIFNSYSILTVDEFWFAHRIYQYKNLLPYRDFAPYKTVIGYYLLLLPMSLTQGVIGTLILTKNMIAVFNTIMLFIAAVWATRFFSKPAILISLILLLSSDIVLSYSTNIRVDLLAYWFCLFSVLFLLEKRHLCAGLMLGIAFTISQKTLWYLFASNIALSFDWLIYQRSINKFKTILSFNFAAIFVISAYIAFWSFISSWHIVVNSVFLEAAAMYKLDWYKHMRSLFWSHTLYYNRILFALCPFTLLSLIFMSRQDKDYRQQTFVIIFAFTVLLCLIPYKQIFPYYMQVTIPIFFILYSAFFTWLFKTLRSQLILSLVGTGVLIGVGTIYSLILFTIKLINYDSAYQKANIAVLNQLLQNGGDYVAGIELIYNKSQSIAGMKHLMGPAISYLYTPTAKLKAMMLPSLDEDPNVTKESVIAGLERASIKCYVNNYRIESLPPEIKSYLSQQFEHLWGSIYIYAPTVPAGKNKITIKFSGNYRIEANNEKNGTLITLTKGEYTFMSQNAYRLKLMPEAIVYPREEKFYNDHWQKLVL